MVAEGERPPPRRLGLALKICDQPRVGDIAEGYDLDAGLQASPLYGPPAHRGLSLARFQFSRRPSQRSEKRADAS